MEPWQILLLTLTGIVAGWLNVMAGGGSLLTIPVMLFMGIPAPVANGTNRIAILLQNIIAVGTFFRRGFAQFRLSLSLAGAASIGALAGANVGIHLEGVWFNRMLALVMIGVMLIMWTGGLHPDKNTGSDQAKNLVAGHILMVGAGFWGGMIQVGVGFILMPILHRVLGLNLILTNVHKVFVIMVYTVIALLVFAVQIELLWWVGLGLAVGNAIGGWLGAKSTITHGEIWIKRVMYIALTAFIIKLLFFA